MPVSQPAFSLNPEPDQNKKDASFIYVVAYYLYPPFTPDSIMSFAVPKFRGKCPGSCQDPETLDPGSKMILTISMRFNSSHQREKIA